MKSNTEPSLRMQVEPGRLVPVDPYSEETLNEYPLGSVVECRIGVDSTSPQRKRYRAILSRVVKQFPTQWKTGTEIDRTIKYTLGVLDYVLPLDVDGAKIPVLGSTTHLSDAEFELFYQGAMNVLRTIIGIDPETLGREDKQESVSSEGSSPLDNTGGEAQASAAPPAAGPDSLVGAPVAAATGSEAELIRKLLVLAQDPALNVEERLFELKAAEANWINALPPDRHAFISKCIASASRVARGDLSAKDAKEYLLSLAKGA